MAGRPAATSGPEGWTRLPTSVAEAASRGRAARQRRWRRCAHRADRRRLLWLGCREHGYSRHGRGEGQCAREKLGRGHTEWTTSAATASPSGGAVCSERTLADWGAQPRVLPSPRTPAPRQAPPPPTAPGWRGRRSEEAAAGSHQGQWPRAHRQHGTARLPGDDR